MRLFGALAIMFVAVFNVLVQIGFWGGLIYLVILILKHFGIL